MGELMDYIRLLEAVLEQSAAVGELLEQEQDLQDTIFSIYHWVMFAALVNVAVMIWFDDLFDFIQKIKDKYGKN